MHWLACEDALHHTGLSAYLFNTHPRPQETAWLPPVPMTLPVAPHPPPYPSHRHAHWSAGDIDSWLIKRWTSASVAVSEDLCWTGVSSTGMWFTSRWMFCFSGV